MELGLACAACHAAQQGGVDHPAATACARCHAGQATIKHGLGHAHMGDAESDASSESHETLSRCVDCHGFGPEPDRKPTDCLRCHARAQGDIGAVTAHATVPCTDCHTVHENKVEAKACTDCHSMNLEHGQTTDDVVGQCRTPSG